MQVELRFSIPTILPGSIVKHFDGDIEMTIEWNASVPGESRSRVRLSEDPKGWTWRDLDEPSIHYTGRTLDWLSWNFNLGAPGKAATADGKVPTVFHILTALSLIPWPKVPASHRRRRKATR